MTELELKYQVPAASRAGLLKAIGNRRLQVTTLNARYFDTPDRRLDRHRMALRLRQEDDRWVQTLKCARPGSFARLEHEVEVLPDDAGELRLDPSRHAGTEAGEQLDRVLRARGLVEVYRTEVTRRLRHVQAHGASLEWALDEGRLVAGERVRPISELELEFKGGDPAGLFKAAIEWQARHGLWLDIISKAERGSLLSQGVLFAAPEKGDAPALQASMTVHEMRRVVLAACLAQILPNAAEIAAGSADAAHVHQLRVGLRRLRTALRDLSVAGSMMADDDATLATVFHALGSLRDRQVLGADIADELRAAGAPLAEPEPIAGDGAGSGELAEVAALVRGAPFQARLVRLAALADGTPVPVAPSADPSEPAGLEPGPEADTSPTRPRALLRERLDHLNRQVMKQAKHFDALALVDRHRLRKRLKRLRYLGEFASSLFEGKRFDRWRKAVGAAQDALGAHIDGSNAAQTFEDAALRDPNAWFAVGWLRARESASAGMARRRLRDLARTRTFW